MTEEQKLALGQIAETNLSQTYTCSVAGCTHPIHIIALGCPNESSSMVRARMAGTVMATTIQYIKDNPSVIS